MRIIDKVNKIIKGWVEQRWFDSLMWFAIVFVVALGSFALGNIYEQQRQREQSPIVVRQNPKALELWNEYQAVKRENLEYVASKNGSVVYPSHCKQAERIKEENRMYFQELDQAFDLGYRESKNC